MSERNQDYQLPSLTVGDKINHSFILANDWMKIGDAIVKPEGFQSIQEVTEATLNFASSIPQELKDELFQEDVKKAIEMKIEDRRPEWCTHKIGPKTPENQVAVPVINPHRLKQACVDLLRRRGYFGRSVIREVSDGNFTDEIEEALKTGKLNDPIATD